MKPVDMAVSDSADLAYTYGTVEFKPADATKPSETKNYFRIWKRQSGRAWTVVLDLFD